MVSPLLPARSRVGRPPKVDLRTILDAILHILATGCQWRALPKDFPPRSTIQHYFYLWRDQHLWRQISLALVRRARLTVGRQPVPSAGVIDSQTAKPQKAAVHAGLTRPRK